MPENIPVVLQDMPTHIRGLVVLGSDYEPVIIINSRLPVEQQRVTYQHELSHIQRGEMDDASYHEYGTSA